MARRKSKKTARTGSFEGVGKGFEEGHEYLIEVKECTVEEGDAAPYFKFVLVGTGEFEGSTMYHNGSMAPGALPRTRDLFEAFLGEVPDGDFDLDEAAEEFVGKQAMCNTFKETYNGTPRMKPEDFWPAEEGDGDGGDTEVDLDDLDDDAIKKLGKELKIKSKRASTIREKLADEDDDDIAAALVKLGLVEESDEDDDDDDENEVDLSDLDDEDIKAVAKAAGIKVTGKSRVNTLKKKLEALDEEDLSEAIKEAGVGEEDEDGEDGELTADDIKEMSEDELEALIEEHDLDVKIGKLKTLRKKRAAVLEAAEEAEILDED